MTEFLTFQTFITPSLLIFIYYIGAVFIPVVSWYLVHWIKSIYFSQKDIHGEIEVTIHITFRQRFIMYAIFLISFLSMEILWRIMIEFFIAYFDMHDALMKLV